MHLVLQRCSRPILAVPDETSELNHPLLVYDGSPQAEEALYVATYLSGQWQSALVVMMTEEGEDVTRNRERVEAYLDERSVTATYVVEHELEAAMILTLATELGNDSLVIGSSGDNPVVGAMTGSTTNEILSSTTLPALICR